MRPSTGQSESSPQTLISKLMSNSEEGARFPISVVSSAIWAGKLPLEKGWACADIADASKTMKSELERTGYLGSLPCSHKTMPLGAHFELHIGALRSEPWFSELTCRSTEQGPILEAEGRKIGAVKGAQAYRWYDIVVTGRAAHTGSTPFSARSDALMCASRIMLANNLIAKSHGGLATTVGGPLLWLDTR